MEERQAPQILQWLLPCYEGADIMVPAHSIDAGAYARLTGAAYENKNQILGAIHFPVPVRRYHGGRRRGLHAVCESPDWLRGERTHLPRSLLSVRAGPTEP